MFEQILDYKKRPWLKHWNDPRTIGLAVFVVIVLLVTWSGVKAVEDNYKLEKQISELRQQNEIQKLANENAKLQNEYYNSDQYLELSARENFGLAAPGEKELIVPENVALSYTKDLPSEGSDTKKTTQQPSYIRNLKAWWNFFRGDRSD